MSDKQILVCARADQPVVVPPGSDFTHRCALCNSLVVVSPAGIQFLKLNPEVVIHCICSTDVTDAIENMAARNLFQLPKGSAEEINGPKQANPHRRRN